MQKTGWEYYYYFEEINSEEINILIRKIRENIL
jgi:hypothetical protein